MVVANDVRAALQSELGEAIEATLAEQARRNEALIAGVRVFAWTLAAIIDIVAAFAPQVVFGADVMVDRTIILLDGGIAVLSGAIALLLRRGFRFGSLRLLVPVFDCLTLTAMFTFMRSDWLAFGFPSSLHFVSLALAASLLAMSGALRLTRASVLTTTVLAAVMLLGCVSELRTELGASALVLSLVAATGLFGLQVTRFVRRAVRAEVERVTYSRFLPEEVVAKAGDPTALIVEPRTVDATVLVSDIRGFTSWAEERPSTEVFAFLNEAQGGFAVAVEAHGGLVDKFLGDGMLAVFGAPQEQEDHAARALAAAQDMLKFVQELRRERQPDLRIGIGVHSGPLAVGCLGSGLRLEFTFIGDTVNTASRLESMTKKAGVPLIVSDETVARIESPPPLTPLGEVDIRGRTQRLEIHSLDPEG